MSGLRVPQVGVQFDDSLNAPAAARAAVVSYFADHRCRDDISLLASELVTNVIRHTHSGGVLEIFDGPTILIEVHDSDPTPASPQSIPPGVHGGFGLHVVNALADAWGTSTTATGKVVWATFGRT